MSAHDDAQRDVEGDPEATTVAPEVASRLGDATATLRALPRPRVTQTCTAPAARAGVDDGPEGYELVRLAEDLQAAIENDDIRLAREAHGALGRQLERADGEERVVDLARERARRRRAR